MPNNSILKKVLNIRGRRIAANAGWLLALQIANYLFPLLLIPTLTRNLGVQNFGSFMIALSFAQFVSLVSDYGFNLTATAEIAKSAGDGARVRRIVSTTWAAKIIIYLLASLTTALIVLAVPPWRDLQSIIFVFFLMPLGNVFFPQWYFLGSEQMHFVTVFNVVAKGVGLVSVILFVRAPSDCLLAAAIYASSFLGAGMISAVIALHKTKGLVWPQWADMMHAYREGWDIFLTSVAITVYTQLVTPLLGVVASKDEVGHFAVAYKVCDAASRIVSPLVQAAFPVVVQAVEIGTEPALKLIRRVGAVILFFALLICLLLYTARSEVWYYLGHNLLGRAENSFAILSTLPILIAISSVLAVLMMVPFGMLGEYKGAYIKAGVVSVLFGVPLIAMFHGTGAAVMVLLGEITGPIVMYTSLRKRGISLL